MNKLLQATLLLLVLPTAAYGVDAKTEITDLLHQFLDGATRNDATIHQQFWADDLVYTSSAGARFGKTELMAGVTSRGKLSEQDITLRYGADDIQIRVYDNTAVLTFTLVGQNDSEQLRFYNMGTLVQGEHGWQVVAWQATRATD